MRKVGSRKRPLPQAVWTTAGAALLTLICAVGCSHPTAATAAPAPSPTPTPTPIADPPAITCPPSITVSATSSAGAPVVFTAPQVSGGAQPVTVSCTRSSGSVFPVGSTAVQCTASDAMNRTASCTFSASVTPAPRISKTTFMAFGDSITSGEVTFPVNSVTPTGQRVTLLPLILVPAAAYPTVLGELLTSRYVLQQAELKMANEGLPGEAARNAFSRFLQVYNLRRPEVLLLMEGYNDVGDTTSGAQSGAADALNRMASEARNRGTLVFIATLAPSRPGFRAPRLESVQAFNDRIRAVARGEGAVLVDVFGALLTNVTAYIGDDGLHPTEIGYRKIAETFFASIRAELEEH